MPRKARQLIADLEKAGFVNRGGKGSHRNYYHPEGQLVTVSGSLGDNVFRIRRNRCAEELRNQSSQNDCIESPSRPLSEIMEWSDEGGCFVGSAPPLIGQCCHGKDETKVYAELCRIVGEWVEIMETDGHALPEPLATKKFSGRFVLRVEPALHRHLGRHQEREDFLKRSGLLKAGDDEEDEAPQNFVSVTIRCGKCSSQASG